MRSIEKPILLTGGIVYPDAGLPRTEQALLLFHGRVLAVGKTADLAALWPGETEVIQLAGRTVLPGLCDAHLHLEQYGRSLDLIDCATLDRAELLRRVRERVERTPAGGWILGHGWNQNDWGGHGSAAELDQVAPAHPVYLTAKSLHAAWVNSVALHLAGIEPGTPDPTGGALVRGTDGAPTGILLEEAMRLVSDRVPPAGDDAVQTQLAHAQRALWAFGITAVHDFDGPRCLRALQRLHRDGRLGLHVLKSIPVELLPHAEALGLQSGFGDDWLRLGHVKIFADGALGPRTAAMLLPYEEEPENLGISMVDREGILEAGIAASRAGLPLAIHAIGDRANHEVLEGLAALRDHETRSNLPHLPHRIEHLQLLHPDDVPRPKLLEVAASMQPIHATSDMRMAERFWASCSRYAYAWESQRKHGAQLVFGSDAPVELPNPFLGLHAAVTRRRPDGSPGPEGWIPEERMALPEALRAFTTSPAELAGLSDRLGRLEPGFWGDLLVLDVDPWKVGADDLVGLRPSATMVAGRWVYPEGGPAW